MKEHRFNLVVKTNSTRKAAELAVLCAFAKRSPDGCEFKLNAVPGDKEAWMAGAKSGTEVAFDLIIKSLENMRKKCGIKRRK